jgi:hypothetical protein
LYQVLFVILGVLFTSSLKWGYYWKRKEKEIEPVVVPSSVFGIEM